MAFETFEKPRATWKEKGPEMAIHKSGMMALSMAAVRMICAPAPGDPVGVDLLYDPETGRAAFRLAENSPRPHVLKFSQGRYRVNAGKFLDHYHVDRSKSRRFEVVDFGDGIFGAVVW